MLVVKHYFLDDFERFETEKLVLQSKSELTEEDVYKMDDQELMELYRECMKETIIEKA